MNEVTTESAPEKPPKLWKKILVPIDFSDLSKQAIRIAVSLAKQFDAKITLLHVVELSSPGFSIDSGTAAYAALDCAQRSLDGIAAEIPPALASERVVRLTGGGVSDKIVDTAQELSSDLIVLATHAYGFFKRLLMGSTAESVNRDAPCEVLVVHDKQNNS
jgi:nucleotide-binding universal stress UspA family protein